MGKKTYLMFDIGNIYIWVLHVKLTSNVINIFIFDIENIIQL